MSVSSLENDVKKLLLALSLVIAGTSLSLSPDNADAARLGAGKAAGTQRATPNQASPAPTPANHATQSAAAPAAAAAAAPAKRNWMGPLAGLAAGLGIAALMSHFGMGEGMGNILTILLVAAAAFFVIRWLMGRFGPKRQEHGMQLAGAGAAPLGSGAFGQPAQPVQPAQPFAPAAYAPQGAAPQGAPGAGMVIGAGVAGAAPAAAPVAVAMPDGMDAAEFERLARMIFIRLQAANDSGNADDLRRFTTPELFASFKADLLERANAPQTTEVVALEARVVDAAKENGQQVVSVRFSGQIREQVGAAPQAFAEVWHLVKPLEGAGDWAIAGITPQALH